MAANSIKEDFPLPEYAAAVTRENEIRNASFLELPHNICGCRVKQITLWHWIILEGIDSPFINGFTKQVPTPEAILQLLWVLSCEFWFWNKLGIKDGNTRFMSWRRNRFIKRFKKIPYGEAAVKCVAFIRDTFQDSLPWEDEKKRGNPVPFYSFASAMIHGIASRFHWSEHDILFMPLKRSNQYLKVIDRIIQIERGERPISFNASDSVKLSELQRLRSEREKSKLHSGQQVSD